MGPSMGPSMVRWVNRDGGEVVLEPEAVLQEVFGPLQWEHSQRVLPVSGTEDLYRATVPYRGREVRIERDHAFVYGSADRGRFRWLCMLRTPIGPYPLRLSVDRHFIGYPKLPTGDASFDEEFRLAGEPDEILREVFDAELRSWLLRLAPLRPWVMSDGDSLWLTITQMVEDGDGDPDLVRQQADLLVAVADRLCAAFERHQQHLVATRGPEAAEAWLREQETDVAGVDQRRRRIRTAILVGVFLLVTGFCCGGLLFGVAKALFP